jgi:hypothetical protein
MEYEINVTTDKGEKFVITVDDDTQIMPSVGTLCRFHFVLEYPVVEFHGYPALNDTGLAREVTMDLKITDVVMTSFYNPVDNFAYVSGVKKGGREIKTITNPTFLTVRQPSYNVSIAANIESITLM